MLTVLYSIVGCSPIMLDRSDREECKQPKKIGTTFLDQKRLWEDRIPFRFRSSYFRSDRTDLDQKEPGPVVDHFLQKKIPLELCVLTLNFQKVWHNGKHSQFVCAVYWFALVNRKHDSLQVNVIPSQKNALYSLLFSYNLLWLQLRRASHRMTSWSICHWKLHSGKNLGVG